MVKKTTKKPTKNGTKQKQKQTVIVNINNGKSHIKKPHVKPSVKNQPQFINTYPMFVQNEPSPPIIYHSPPVPYQSTPLIPVKITNEIGTQFEKKTNEIGTQFDKKSNEIGTQFEKNTREIGTETSIFLKVKKPRKLKFTTPSTSDNDNVNGDYIPPKTPPVNLEKFYPKDNDLLANYDFEALQASLRKRRLLDNEKNEKNEKNRLAKNERQRARYAKNNPKPTDK